MPSHIQKSSQRGWGRRILALVVLGMSVTSGVQGATLRWKFHPGETLQYTMEQKTVNTLKIPGAPDQKTTMAQTIEMTWSVKSVDPSGVAELTQTISRIRDQVEGSVGTYTYDSKDGKEPESLIAAARLPIFKALLGTPVPFKITPRGEVGDVRVPATLTRTMNELGATAPEAEAMLSQEGLKELIGRVSLVLPEENLEPGKTWTQQTRRASAQATLTLDMTYRLEAPAPNTSPDVARLATTVKADIQSAQSDPNSGKIRSQKSEGRCLFDTARGHTLDWSHSESIEIAFTVKLGLGPQAKQSEIVQVNESTTVLKLVK
jgi:hypothetical protein